MKIDDVKGTINKRNALGKLYADPRYLALQGTKTEIERQIDRLYDKYLSKENDL